MQLFEHTLDEHGDLCHESDEVHVHERKLSVEVPEIQEMEIEANGSVA